MFRFIYHCCLKLKSNLIIEMILIIACPATCKTCKSGGAADGGLPVSSEGICGYFCSRGGYCGNGPNYRRGEDCLGGCNIS